MNEEIEKMLDEVIIFEIQSLADLSTGSQEKSTAIDDLAKLYKLRIEEIKLDTERMEKAARCAMDYNIQNSEASLKDFQMSEQVKDRYSRLAIAAAEIIIPLIFYAAWMRRGFRFEETGTYTSTTFKGLFNRFRPTK